MTQPAMTQPAMTQPDRLGLTLILVANNGGGGVAGNRSCRLLAIRFLGGLFDDPLMARSSGS